MTETLRVWTRHELEEAARLDQPEGLSMLKVGVSPRLMLLLIDYQSQRGQRVEMVSAVGDPRDVELRFYRSDT